MKQAYRLFTLFALLLTATLVVNAEGMREKDTDSQKVIKKRKDPLKRKKVAVVLSGGGAKGMAHIGVLKVIEEAGLPIDIITGTSMGSIVGGLYAIGYNANALDSVVRTQDWSYVITDKENLTQQSLEDRKKHYTYAINTSFTLRKRVKAAGGFIRGKNLTELFQKLCAGYTDSLDFTRDLPIPFACVATDVMDNTEYDFFSGRLPQAIRASMAIPAVFAPVRLGDRVLVDGGLRNNYPADLAKQMGADIIIGVTVTDPPKKPDDMGTAVNILGQIVENNCKNKFEENLAITDVPIYVDPTGYSAASFSASAIDTLIHRGEVEARKHWDELIALKKRIGIDSTFKPERLSPLHPEVMNEKERVTTYEFRNMTRSDERFLRDKFRLHDATPEGHDSINAIREQQITTSMRMDLFYQTAECKSVPDCNGVRIVLTAGERKTGQVYAGLRYDNEEYATVQLGTVLPLKLSIPTNTDFTLRLGRRIMVREELTFHPRSFTRPMLSYSYHRNDVDVYVEGHRDYSILYHQHQAELMPVNIVVKHFDVRAGIRWDYLHYGEKLVSTQSNDIQLEDDHFFSYRFLMHYNSEDNWYFPTRGSRFKGEYAYITDNGSKLEGKRGMSEINAQWRKSFTFGSRFTLQPLLYGRLTFGNNIPFAFANCIGGQWFGHYTEQQMPFPGVNNIEYVDNQLVAFQLQAQQRLATNHYVLLRAATALYATHLKKFNDHGSITGVEGAYFYNTIIGPIGGTLGYSNRTHKLSFYINVGYEF